MFDYVYVKTMTESSVVHIYSSVIYSFIYCIFIQNNLIVIFFSNAENSAERSS